MALGWGWCWAYGALWLLTTHNEDSVEVLCFDLPPAPLVLPGGDQEHADHDPDFNPDPNVIDPG